MPHQSNSRMQYLQWMMFACLVFGGRTSLGQINADNYDRVPSWRFQPPADPPSPTADTRTPAEISIEDNYFDSWSEASDPLDGPPVQRPGTVVGSSPGGLDQDFPIWSRDEVVVAHFSTWLSHLSSSHRAVYTTVYLQVDRVVSDKSGQLVAGSVTPLLIPGGIILAPGTQKVISHLLRAGDFPLEPNTEYLIFLNQEPSLPFYQYAKAWKVDKGILEPVNKYDAFRVAQGRSTHSGMSLESAINELNSH